jgi:hypothetical protein
VTTSRQLRIPWGRVLVSGWGLADKSPTGSCFAVLTKRYFGWIPVIYTGLPSFGDGSYYVVPVTAIDRVEVSPRSWASFKEFTVFWKNDQGQTQAFTVEMVMIYLWVSRFLSLGVPVVGGEGAALNTVRGFLYHFGMLVWGGTIAFGSLGFLTVSSLLGLPPSAGELVTVCLMASLLIPLPFLWAKSWEAVADRRQVREHRENAGQGRNR